VGNPPPPAENWTETEIEACVAAANSALEDGESEEDAIFACIGAAGKEDGGSHPHGIHECYCPECGATKDADTGEKCNTLVCPECGAQMRATTTGENRGDKEFTMTDKLVLVQASRVLSHEQITDAVWSYVYGGSGSSTNAPPGEQSSVYFTVDATYDEYADVRGSDNS